VTVVGKDVFTPGNCHGFNNSVLSLKKKWTHVVLQMIDSVTSLQYACTHEDVRTKKITLQSPTGRTFSS
jgi:hypothetical protein